jgi:outer membrane protein
MQKTLFIFLALIFGLNFASGQKFGYIDSEYILGKMPEYKKAQDELTQFANGWQKEAEDMDGKIQSMYARYRAEEVLLTEEMRKERTDEIKKMENELREFQKKVFGFEGLYFLKKKELMKPLQDKVWDASERVAKSNRLAIIFDKAGELVMIYTDPRHDYSDFILEELGLGDPNDKIK